MAKKSKRQPRRCGICGRKLPSEQYVRSRFTGNYFCRYGDKNSCSLGSKRNESKNGREEGEAQPQVFQSQQNGNTTTATNTEPTSSAKNIVPTSVPA